MEKAGARPAFRRSFVAVYASAQARHVVGHGLHLAVIHLAGDGGHLRVVASHTRAEGEQLRFCIVGMLATQTRVLRRDAGAVGAVAAGAGRHGLAEYAAAVDLLAQGNRFLDLCKTRLRRLGREVGGDLLHVVIRQGRGHAHHDGVLALAALEFRQLLEDVFRVLALQNRVGR